MKNSTSGTARFPRRRRLLQRRHRSRGARRRSSASPSTRVDAYDRVSGSATYPSDVMLPDMLHAAILSCPHAHAMVKTVDTSAAEKMPGVRAVLKDGVAGTNIPWFAGRGGFASRLFDPHCRYEGDEVAVVAADTIYQAWDAVRAIKVEYDVLPQVTSVDDAMKPGAPAVRDGGNAIPPGQPYARGDVEAAFKTADVVVEHMFTTPFELHNAMELHGCVAKWDGPRLTIWESTQGVYGVQTGVARALDLPLANIRVIGHYMGGGFGAKLDPRQVHVMAALLAKKTGRPVRLFLTREQVCMSMGNRPGNTITLKAGAKKDGTLVALQSKIVGSGGAYSDGGTGGVDYVIRELYACPNVRCENQSVLHQRRARSGAFRAPGHPQGAWALEIMHGRAGGEDSAWTPIALRLKNITLVSQTRNGNPPYTSTGFADCLKNGAKAFGWAEARARKPAAVAHQARRRRGRRHVAGRRPAARRRPSSSSCSPTAARTSTWARATSAAAPRRGARRSSPRSSACRSTASRSSTPTPARRSSRRRAAAARPCRPSRRRSDAAALDVKQQLFAMAAEQLKLPAADLELRGAEVVSKSDADEEGRPRPDPGVRPARACSSASAIGGRTRPGKADNPFARAVRRGRGQHEDRRDQGAALPRGARQRPDHERARRSRTRCSAASRWASGSA